MTTCPAPFTTVTLPSSTLCVYRDAFTNNWDTGAYFCTFTYGAQLCTHDQLRRACSLGGYSLVAGAWMRDRAGNDSALYVDTTNCDNFDGIQGGQTGASGVPTQPASYCCNEWMTYP